jgi:hypothetical protein
MNTNLKYGSYGYAFEVRELEKGEYPEWDSFVDKSPQGTVFHKASWLDSDEDYEFKILACMHKGNIVAGMPLPYIRRYGVKLGTHPFLTEYLGVLFRESNQKYNTRLSFERELSKALAKTVKNFAPYIKYAFHSNFVDPLPFVYTGLSVRTNFHYVLSLEGDLDAILNGMEKDTRNRIVRSLKNDLEFSDSSKEMAELICLSYKRKNQRPPLSREVYARHLDALSKTKAVRSIVAKDGDDLLAGGTIAYDSKSAYYILGGFNSDKHKGVGPLVIWKLIRHAKEVLGLREFDFGNPPLNENTERFYRGFGGKLTHNYVVYKSNMLYYLMRAWVKMNWKVRATF